MQIQEVILLFSIAVGIVAAVIFQFQFRKSLMAFPENWKSHPSLKKFRTATLLLCIYLIVNLISEVVAMNMAWNKIYNCYIYTLNNTFSVALFFSLLFLYTRTPWKQFSYIVLFGILLGYFILSGQFHPLSVGTKIRAVFIFGVYVLGTIIHLTDLLVDPKVEYFMFQLKVNLYFLIYNFLASIILTFSWLNITSPEYLLDLLWNIHIVLTMLFYLSLALIFIQKTLKLRRT